jgi:hypothetical protein
LTPKKKTQQQAYHVGILVLIDNTGVLKLDVEVLVNRVERPTYCQVILELHCDLLPHELLEVGEEQLQKKKGASIDLWHSSSKKQIISTYKRKYYHNGSCNCLLSSVDP